VSDVVLTSCGVTEPVHHQTTPFAATATIQCQSFVLTYASSHFQHRSTAFSTTLCCNSVHYEFTESGSVVKYKSRSISLLYLMHNGYRWLGSFA